MLQLLVERLFHMAYKVGQRVVAGVPTLSLKGMCVREEDINITLQRERLFSEDSFRKEEAFV